MGLKGLLHMLNAIAFLRKWTIFRFSLIISLGFYLFFSLEFLFSMVMIYILLWEPFS